MFNLLKKESKQALLYLDNQGFSVLYYDRVDLSCKSSQFKKKTAEGSIKGDLKAFVDQYHLAKAPLSVVLGPDQYQMILIDRPNVEEKELAESAMWLVKDQMTLPVEEAFLQIFKPPEFQIGAPKLYVVAVEKNVLYALQQASEFVGLQLSEVNILDLSFAKLLESRGHVGLFYSQGGCLYFLCLNQGTLMYRQALGKIEDLMKENVKNMSLVCQRLIDQYEVMTQSSLEECFLTFELLHSDFVKQVSLTLPFQSIPLVRTIAEFSIAPEEFEKILPLVGEMQNATED
jgi:hypothetical protein